MLRLPLFLAMHRLPGMLSPSFPHIRMSMHVFPELRMILHVFRVVHQTRITLQLLIDVRMAIEESVLVSQSAARLISRLKGSNLGGFLSDGLIANWQHERPG